MPNHINDWTIVLQLGAEGGSMTLYGMETERGWLFSRNVSDWTPELVGEERVQHKSPVVDSWDAAVALLDQYPWQRLSPLMVHPEFSERIRSAARDRLQRNQAPARYFDMWCSMITAGNHSL
jgi:hypothetical protein